MFFLHVETFVGGYMKSMCNVHGFAAGKETSWFGYEKLKHFICLCFLLIFTTPEVIWSADCLFQFIIHSLCERILPTNYSIPTLMYLCLLLCFLKEKDIFSWHLKRLITFKNKAQMCKITTKIAACLNGKIRQIALKSIYIPYLCRSTSISEAASNGVTSCGISPLPWKIAESSLLMLSQISSSSSSVVSITPFVWADAESIDIFNVTSNSHSQAAGTLNYW